MAKAETEKVRFETIALRLKKDERERFETLHAIAQDRSPIEVPPTVVIRYLMGLEKGDLLTEKEMNIFRGLAQARDIEIEDAGKTGTNNTASKSNLFNRAKKDEA